MPRRKKMEDAGEAKTPKSVDLTQEERDALVRAVPATGPVFKMRDQDGPAVGGDIDVHATVSQDAVWNKDLLVQDESHLSTDEKVGRLAQLYRKVASMQLVIGLWVLLNVFRNNLKEARSKDPKKRNAFNAICNHPELPEDLKGDTLNRYVVAAVTMRELQWKGVDTASMEYYHFREISKIQGESTREKVAREVVLQSLTVRQTQELVKTEVEKEKAKKGKRKAPASSASKISDLAHSIVFKLDSPTDLIIPDEDTRSLLLDPSRLTSEFDFGDRAAIYEKAKSVLRRRSDDLGGLKQSFSTVEADVNFLEELIRAIDGKPVKAQAD